MRQRPTLPGRLQPSTIGVLRLNFCVRNGNRWNPQAITTAKGELCLPPSLYARLGYKRGVFTPFGQPCTLTTVYEFEIGFGHFLLVFWMGVLPPNQLNQAIDLLVSSSCMHYCTSTDDLSTW